jgi:hypothetical protein
MCPLLLSAQELKAHCEKCGLQYRFLPSGDTAKSSSGGRSLAAEGVDVVFRISIPSAERTALLMQSTGEESQ